MNANEKTTLHLSAGQVLTITAAAGVTGLVVRLQPQPGGGDAQSVTAIAGADLSFGPYAQTERFEIFCTTGTLTIATAAFDPATLATDIETAAVAAALLTAPAFVSIGLPEKTPINAVAASKLLTIGTAPAEGATVSIGGVTYKFTATLVAANDVLIGTIETSIDNLVLAVTAGAGAGTNYGTGTVANPLATAVKTSPSTMTATNLIKGAIGNQTAITETLADGSWADDAVYLTGGIDGTVGITNEICADSSYIYHCVGANTVAQANWRRIARGSVY